MHAVRVGDYWCPKTKDVVFRNCADIPSKEVVWDAFQIVLK